MNWSNFFSTLPAFGWFIIFLLVVLIASVMYGVYKLLRNKDIQLKNFSAIQHETAEKYQNIGKNTLDNQCSTAHNFLKKIWVDIYETGKKIFDIDDSKDLFILEDIAHLIEGKLNYEVKNDLTRNHITEKSDIDLTKYSDAKAIGYYRAVTANLYDYNVQLPDYYLPDIMNHISVDDFKKLFSEIYFSARKIAGGKY